MLSRSAAILALLPTLACTPLQRADTLTAVGAASCGAGQALDAAGQDWGALLSAVGCWLADWSAARADRRAEAQAARERGLESAKAPTPLEEYDALDQAAVELSAAQARYVADPCEATAAELGRLYARCLALSAGE